MRSLITVFLCLLVACTRAGTTPVVNVTVPVSSAVTSSSGQTGEDKQTEKDELVDLEKLPDFPAQPVLKGTPSPEDGILFSPRHAAEVALDAAEADKLHVENRVITNTREKELALLEAYIEKQDKELAECRKKNWWDRNGGATLVGLGVVAGISMSLAVFKISAHIATSEK